MNRKLICAVIGSITCAVTSVAAQAQSNDKLRIGFISDLSGPFADNDGPGSLEAIRMAVADAGGKVNGKQIEVLFADHQNKADLASLKTREWADTQGLKMLIAGANSAAAVAEAKIAAEKKFVFIPIAAGAPSLVNEECTPYTVHYAYDTTAVSNVMGSAITGTGGKSWFFLTADYTFGHALESDTMKVVRENGGSVLGAARHPTNSSDFSAFLLSAQASKPQVLGLANSGSDTLNAIKGAKEFGMTKDTKIAGLLMFIGNIHALGLADAQGLLMTESWYWDKDDASRGFARRYFEKMKKMPNSLQAASYSAAANYIKAVKAVGSDDADKVMEYLKKTPLEDFYAKGYIREDGKYVHDMYLLQVKKPSESKQPWDYLKIISAVPGEKAFAPLSASKCAFVKKK